jgi:protocatechuate 3,4-dioxygenase alpha subunit
VARAWASPPHFEDVDEDEANANCPVMKRIESPARRQTLIAKREEADGKVCYRLDIKLQGEGETVFFDF